MKNLDIDPNRSRSIFRQVRDTIGSMSRTRHRAETRIGSPTNFIY